MRRFLPFAAVLTALGAEPNSIQGDFNADGVPDTAKLARFHKETPEGVMVANPWKLSNQAPRAGTLGILVHFGGGRQMPMFLADADFFASPIWQKPEPSLVRAKKRGKKQAIAVATESGADELLVWTGKGWKVIPEEEMP